MPLDSMTSYFTEDYCEVGWWNKRWATNFNSTEMQNINPTSELWVPDVASWCFPAFFNFSVCWVLLLSFSWVPPQHCWEVSLLTSPKSLIPLIAHFHLTPNPGYPLSWMLHRAALALVFWAPSDPCTGVTVTCWASSTTGCFSGFYLLLSV